MTLATTDDSIETERLVLRRMTQDDFPFFARIHADPEVARYIGRGQPRTPEESRLFIDGVLASYAAVGLGQLVITRKSDGALIGRSGISFMEVEQTPDATGVRTGYFVLGDAPAGVPTYSERELGYVLDRGAWGQGFAREAVAGVRAYATGRLGLERIVSIIHPDNVRSLRLAQSFGVTRTDQIRYYQTAFDLFVWPSI